MSPTAYSSTATMSATDGHIGGARKGRAPFRHIQDLVSVGVQLDPHTPLRRLLEVGHTHMRQAITYNDFRRPDLALQEYIRAFTIAVDKVPKHKEYPSLKADRGDLNRLYTMLKANITTHGATFDRIKEDIKEDNRVSGVRPERPVAFTSDNTSIALPTPSSGMLPHHNANQSEALPQSSHDRPANNDSNGTSVPASKPKPKPPIHPKPPALQGHATKAAPTPQDLATRFANLRDSPGSQHSDQPIPHRSRPAIDSSMPIMPKLPDAVYSPARGTLTSEVADLPSSTPRGMFSRTNSLASAPSNAARASMENALKALSGPREQFVTAHSWDPSDTARIPPGDKLSPEQLIEIMERGSRRVQLLLIDVRNRELFDEGHIMSQSTICVEPEVLLRENISAEEVHESMVLSTSQESQAFESRAKVDIVVIYDQDSTSFPTKVTGEPREMVLYNLQQALSQYSYSKPLQHPPKLLVGGLEAWVDKMGQQALATSTTLDYTSSSNGVSTQPPIKSGRPRNLTRKLEPEEIEKFEAMASFDYAKTEEDFHRRYPAMTGLPESMTSPARDVKPPVRKLEFMHDEDMDGLARKPPARPRPSVAKTRYSGLESAQDNMSTGGQALMTGRSGTSVLQNKLTGLQNPHVWCYSNSTLQVLLATPGFSNELLDERWPATWRPNPIRKHDPAYPQLMCKILGNLMQWLDKRTLTAIKTTTLMAYLRSIHQGGTYGVFGGPNQHDASEYFTFVMTQLDAETRQVYPGLSLPRTSDPQIDRLITLYERSLRSLAEGDSIYRSQFCFTVLRKSTCTVCSAVHYEGIRDFNYAPTLPGGEGPQILDLRAWMKGYFEGTGDQPPASMCEYDGEDRAGNKDQYCNKNTIHKHEFKIGRLPPLLRLDLQRNVGLDYKNSSGVSAPIQGTTLSFADYMLDANKRKTLQQTLDGYEEGIGDVPTEYELYAFTNHIGPTIASGHYTAVVKTQPSEWILCNDTQISIVANGTDGNINKVLDKNFFKGNVNPRDRTATGEKRSNDEVYGTPYSLFYRRLDITPRWR
ncbi:hypothetical protein F5Y15DRAFT_377251 [Xylariaceae sp. FL0016]|nr:hypothetical protein F5Y15DRAFT_377251 [Xylariaceae sp. FL0016]